VEFTVRYHPEVKEIDLPRINVKMRERIRRAIESRLMTAPQEYALPLRKNLGGFWKLRVGDYRVVFKVEGEMVYILAIRHRRSVYDDVTGGSQVLGKLRLAPEIQKRVLTHPVSVRRTSITELLLRPITGITDHRDQIQEYYKLLKQAAVPLRPRSPEGSCRN
jgi:mRNA interferase RelE/StbE